MDHLCVPPSFFSPFFFFSPFVHLFFTSFCLPVSTVAEVCRDLSQFNGLKIQSRSGSKKEVRSKPRNASFTTAEDQKINSCSVQLLTDNKINKVTTSIVALI